MDLKRAFFFGHTCDLAFHGALRTISSGFAWARHCASLGETCQWSQSTVVCLTMLSARAVVLLASTLGRSRLKLTNVFITFGMLGV